MAVLTALQYTRSRVKAAKTHQRVRLTGISAAPTNQEVFNLTHRMGFYARVWVEGSNIRFAWSSYGAPPLVHSVDTGVGCTEPRFCWDPHAPLSILLVCTGASGIEERRSDDDGWTYNLPTNRFAGGRHPDIAVSREGLILRAAYVAGAISASRQYPGDASPGTVFNLKDSSGVDLAVADDSFRLVSDSRGWWWLHVKLAAAAATSIWYSTDDATSFSLASTGISGGSHPGIVCAPDGTLYAWAYVAGAAYLTRRSPGETAWSTPAPMKDHAGANLSVKDASFSLAPGRERSDRLILAAVASTDTVPCDHWSSDLSTFKVF